MNYLIKTNKGYVEINGVNEKDLIKTFNERFPNLIILSVKTFKETLPNGWKRKEGATTAPKGYYWGWNGKSHFSGEYESSLIKWN